MMHFNICNISTTPTLLRDEVRPNYMACWASRLFWSSFCSACSSLRSCNVWENLDQSSVLGMARDWRTKKSINHPKKLAPKVSSEFRLHLSHVVDVHVALVVAYANVQPSLVPATLIGSNPVLYYRACRRYLQDRQVVKTKAWRKVKPLQQTSVSMLRFHKSSLPDPSTVEKMAGWTEDHFAS